MSLLPTLSTEERRQFPILFWSSVRRLSENDLIPESVALRQSVIWLAALFATLLATASMLGYSPWQTFEERAVKALWDKQFFLGYSMVAAGFLTVLMWDAIFLDRRDSMVLGVLPVRERTIVLTKVSAVSAVMLAFAISVNVPTTIVFSFASGGYEGAGHFARTFIGHGLSTVAAGVFSFLVVLAVQTTLTLVLPRRLLGGVSLLAQLLFVVCVIGWLAFGPPVLRQLVEAELARAGESFQLGQQYALHAGVLTTGAAGWWPPTWFLGLYEVIVFIEPVHFQRLALTAVGALALALVTAVATYTLSLRRVMGRTLETPGVSGQTSGWATASDWMLAAMIRHPVQRGVAGFATKSLLRSRRHRLLLAVYMGIGLAFTVGSFLAPFLLELTTGVATARPTAELLSVPLVLSFFSLVGLRVLFVIPTDLAPNWVFRITESADRVAYVNGTRSTMFLVGLMPIAALTVPWYWTLWGGGLALGHTVFWLLAAAVLTELLLFRFDRVPFTCAYVPGKANVKLLWPLYILAMTTYAYSTARVELWLLAEPMRIVIACLAGAFLVFILRNRSRWASDQPALKYEDEIEATVQTLGLMPRI